MVFDFVNRCASRTLVTILEEEPVLPQETVMLSEQSLGEDWNRPEEDAAWAHLQRERSLIELLIGVWSRLAFLTSQRY